MRLKYNAIHKKNLILHSPSKLCLKKMIKVIYFFNAKKKNLHNISLKHRKQIAKYFYMKDSIFALKTNDTKTLK